MDERVMLVASEWTLLAVGIVACVLIIAAAVRAPNKRVLIPASAGVLSFAVLVAGVSGMPQGGVEALGQVFLVAFPLLLATFPDGRFVPRWTIWVVAISPVALLLNTVLGGWLTDQPWWFLVPSMSLVLIGAQLYRYRRAATTLEREQIRWVLLGTMVTVTIFEVLLVIDDGVAGTGPASEARAALALLPLMAGVTIAFARPRLANVDVPLRYVLAAWVAGVVLVPLFWGVWWATEAMTDAAVRALICTTVVAVAAYPAIRLGLFVGDRAVLRGRLRPGAAVSLLGRRLASEPEAENAAEAVVSTVVDALGVPWARLDSPFAGLETTSPAGDEHAQGDEFSITYQGESLAALVVPPRPGESELTRFDRDLITQLAMHAGPALHGARTLSELSDAHARTVLAREEERRRLRRELHDDLGPALSGLALGAAAIATRAASIDAGIAETARELQADIGDAVARSREISHGLRPSVLDDRGLEAAIRDRLGPTSDLRLDVGEIGDLPAAVDLAALRIVQEAVTNARWHAAASVCSVRVDREGAVLRVEVADNGVGMPRTVTPGLGLRSIRERATELGGRARVSQPAGGGTLVSVWLPIGEGVTG